MQSSLPSDWATLFLHCSLFNVTHLPYLIREIHVGRNLSWCIQHHSCRVLRCTSMFWNRIPPWTHTPINRSSSYKLFVVWNVPLLLGDCVGGPLVSKPTFGDKFEQKERRAGGVRSEFKDGDQGIHCARAESLGQDLCLIGSQIDSSWLWRVTATPG